MSPYFVPFVWFIGIIVVTGCIIALIWAVNRWG